MADAPKFAAVKAISSKMTREDQGEVQWFFGRGQVEFERSTMGSMLERAKTFNLFAIREMYKKNGERSPDPHGPETARPTAEVHEIVGHEPDHAALTMYARVSRRLMKMEREWRVGVVVLETFYGDVGARWADSREKRLFSLYSLTIAGKQLLKADAVKYPNRVVMPDHERLGVLSALERMPGQSKLARKMLLRKCEPQSLALLAEAGRLWNQVKT